MSQALLPEIWELKTENRDLRIRLADAAPHAAQTLAAARGGGGAGRAAGVDGGFQFGGADGSLSSGLFRRSDAGRPPAPRPAAPGGGGGWRGVGEQGGWSGEREASVRMQELVASCRDLEVGMCQGHVGHAG